MKKRLIAIGLIGTLIIFTGCGDDHGSSSKKTSRHESVLTEETLVEEIIVEEIRVEEIQVNEITWDDNVTRWD